MGFFALARLEVLHGLPLIIFGKVLDKQLLNLIHQLDCLL